MRLSRPRLALRAALLVTGGAFMLWKANAARTGAAAAAGGEGLLLSRIALVEALVGVLALAAAVVALLSMRPRRRRHTLRLGDLEPRGRGPR